MPHAYLCELLIYNYVIHVFFIMETLIFGLSSVFFFRLHKNNTMTTYN